jgi:hypothetical protein
MNDLHAWLSQQHHGLQTFHTFQQKTRNLEQGRARATGLVPVAGLFTRQLNRSF